MKPIAWEKKLNPRQLEAVRHRDGPLLILAGAGSGKTRVIVHRIAHLIREYGVPPDRILAVSFTNKAAEEMRERVHALVGPTRGLTVSTFHSFCVRVLRRDIEALERKRNFTIYTAEDQTSLIKQLLIQAGEDDARETVWSVHSTISNAKNAGWGPGAFAQSVREGSRLKRLASEIYPEYQRALYRFNALDFDDLLMMAVELLRAHPNIREGWADRYRYLMVDEYQDTNGIQLELLRLLAGGHRNLAVVGDDDQAIYGWRGADISNILDFEKHFAPCKVVALEQNYRSTNNILEAANHIIAFNHARRSKRLFSDHGSGPPIEIHTLRDDEQEAEWTIQKIREHHAEYGKWSDFAVLYRTNSQSRILEDAFRYAQIPYRIVGGMQFYERKEIRDFLAYLKAVANPQDEISLLRILNWPARGVGKTSIERLIAFSRSERLDIGTVLERLEAPRLDLPPKARAALGSLRDRLAALHARIDAEGAGDLARRVEADFGLVAAVKADESDPERGESRAENLRELINTIYRYEASADPDEAGLARFLERITLVESGGDKRDEERRNAVHCMTLHSAKGLEFPAVFLIGMEEELFPHRRSTEENRIDEERRLCYVGLTRAQHRLFLSHPAVRFYYGKPQRRLPSRFLAELPTDERQVRRYDWTSEESGPDADSLMQNYFKQFLGDE